MFKQLDMVYVENGENEGTLSPLCALVDFKGDLNEERWACVSSDNNMRIKIDKYKVKKIWLPAWLSSAEYCANPVKWKFLWAYHKKASEMTENAQRALVDLDAQMQYWLVQLVAANTRSPFRQNIKDQVLAWCDKKVNGETEYNQPLSHKQMDAIKGAYWCFKSTSEGVSRSYNGVPMY